MIDVNIWLSTTVVLKKKITHGIFGPLLASEANGENVGHANLTMDIDESSENYRYIESNFSALRPKKTLSIIPTPVTNEQNWSHVAPQTVKSYQFTHSMWPAAGGASSTHIFKTDTKRAFHLSKKRPGIRAHFNTHDNDMIREEIGTNTHVVSHKKSCKETIQRKKLRNLDLLSQISDLEIHFENAARYEDKLRQFQTEQTELIGHAEQNKISYDEEMNRYLARKNSNSLEQETISRRLTALERTNNYLSKIQNMDVATRRQFATIQEQLVNLRTEQERITQENAQITAMISTLEDRYAAYCNEINNELASNRLAISSYSQELDIIVAAIDGKTLDDLESMRQQAHQRVDYIHRKEQFLLTKEKTEGRHPDHVIKLPISRDGWEFHLDEIKILEAMEAERSTNYSFIFHNCSTSVKRCLLAGITDTLREQLLETGLKESFFHLNKIETCKGLRDWARQLERSLIQLNFSLNKDEDKDEDEDEDEDEDTVYIPTRHTK